MSEIDSLKQRIEELELKTTFQDDLIEQLNDSLVAQQDDIRKLVRIIEKLDSEVKTVREGNVIDVAQESPPPHY